MKNATYDQIKVVAIDVLNLNKANINGDALQGALELSAEERQRRLTAFCNNGFQFTIKGTSALAVDRTKPFNPVAFIGPGWSLVEEDERALTITEIDLSSISFEHWLTEGEMTSITGEVKLQRMKADGRIRLDAKVGQTLYEEKGQPTLRFLYDIYGIDWFELAGTVLCYSGGSRCFLCLYRRGDGSWYWDDHWLGRDRPQTRVSPVLASPQT